MLAGLQQDYHAMGQLETLDQRAFKQLWLRCNPQNWRNVLVPFCDNDVTVAAVNASGVQEHAMNSTTVKLWLGGSDADSRQCHFYTYWQCAWGGIQVVVTALPRGLEELMVMMISQLVDDVACFYISEVQSQQFRGAMKVLEREGRLSVCRSGNGAAWVCIFRTKELRLAMWAPARE